MKEQIKIIQNEDFQLITLDEIMDHYKSRKVGERLVRVSTPIAELRWIEEDIPSPMAKNYKSEVSAASLANHLPSLSSPKSDNQSGSLHNTTEEHSGIQPGISYKKLREMIQY